MVTLPKGKKPIGCLDEADEALTSIEQNLKLTAEETEEDPFLQEAGTYRRLIGKLLYLTLTRPDISFVVQVLSQFMQTPKESHMKAALRLVKYVKDRLGYGVFLSATSLIHLECFCDSDHGGCSYTRRSVTGFLVKLGGSLIYWKSKKQNIVSRSSTEVEYRALAMATSELT
ncbi:uncharacterized protein LOC114723828 [Neltuma alba]|uniref:uncharacterized protein LOC114723828 n=1 Tax=Neltuma alba TaxID=207710 RepID=UPI0010A46F78|nr:uncharacterized protein LOC114723828 [Prosopis alba]